MSREQQMRLKTIITDLLVMKQDLLGDKDTEATKIKIKGKGKFLAKQMEAQSVLNQLKGKVERLVEIRKANGTDYRDANTIALKAEIREETKTASKLIGELTTFVAKEEQKHKGRATEKKEAIEEHHEVIKILRETLAFINSLMGLTATPQERRLEQEMTKVAQHRQKKKQARKEGLTDIPMMPMGHDNGLPSEQEEAFMVMVEENQAKQDELLTEIGKGLDELHQMALDMNKILTQQEHMLAETDKQMEETTKKFKTANRRLKELLDQSGGASRWGPALILCIVLLGLVGVFFGLI